MGAMLTQSLHHFRPAAKRSRERTEAPTKKPVLIQADLDHTLISWRDRENQIPDHKGFRAAARSLKSHQGKALIGISTARALAESTRLASVLAGVPLDFLATNSGQQLFLNSEGKPTEQFLQELTFADADPEWDSTLQKQFGWNNLKASILVRDQLEKAGFKQVANPNPNQTELLYSVEDVEVRLQPDQTYFKFRYRDKEGQKLVDAFMQSLHTTFQDNGLKCQQGPQYKWDFEHVRSLIPEGPNKTALLEHLVERSPSTQVVITAGDRVADSLEPSSVNGLPNLRVVAGERKETKAVRKSPGVVSTRKGYIAPGLDAQMKALSPILEAGPQ